MITYVLLIIASLLIVALSFLLYFLIKEQLFLIRLSKAKNLSSKQKEPPMTIGNEERIEFIKEEIAEVTKLVEENPEIVENVGKLISKYGDVLTPLILKLSRVGIDLRKEAFEEFVEMGLTTDQAIKMACGR